MPATFKTRLKETTSSFDPAPPPMAPVPSLNLSRPSQPDAPNRDVPPLEVGDGLVPECAQEPSRETIDKYRPPDATDRQTILDRVSEQLDGLAARLEEKIRKDARGRTPPPRASLRISSSNRAASPSSCSLTRSSMVCRSVASGGLYLSMVSRAMVLARSRNEPITTSRGGTSRLGASRLGSLKLGRVRLGTGAIGGGAGSGTMPSFRRA